MTDINIIKRQYVFKWTY